MATLTVTDCPCFSNCIMQNKQDRLDHFTDKWRTRLTE